MKMVSLSNGSYFDLSAGIGFAGYFHAWNRWRIQILKSIHEMELKTKIIFISGFQDFEYAKSAITYGAVEYLLKPVILEQLLSAVEKALSMLYMKSPESKKPVLLQEKKTETTVALEETTYILVLAAVLFEGREGMQERKLFRIFPDEFPGRIFNRAKEWDFIFQK